MIHRPTLRSAAPDHAAPVTAGGPMSRLLRTCSSLLLALALGGPLAALETSLLQFNGQGGAVVNAGTGMITIYEVTNAQSTRKSVFNFLSDMALLEAKIKGEINGSVFSELRTGTENMDPVVETLIQKMFRKEATKEQKDKGKPSDQVLVREAEEAFWAKSPAYDGVVQVAYGPKKMMVVIPAKHVVLFYEVSDPLHPTFAGSYNFGPALYVALGYNTLPNPIDIASQLQLDTEEQKKLQESFKQTEDGGPAQAAKCEIWCANSGDFFALVDAANNKVILFEDVGKKIALRSVRSISADLAIPVGFHAEPDEVAALQTLIKDNKTVGETLKEMGLTPFDQYTLRAFVNHIQVGEESKKAEALQATKNNSQIVLDFTGQRKLLVYNLQGSGNSLELASARDYTFEVGLNTVARFANNRVNGPRLWDNAKENLKAGRTKSALSVLESAIKMTPLVTAAAAKDQGFKKLKDADKEAFDALIETGTKANEELKTTVKTIVEEAAEARDKAKKKK
jgi:hypothetical protein